MQRNSPFAESEFDRSFRRAQRLMKIWFIFILCLVLTVFVGVSYTIYSVLTQPEIVGEFAGRIASGYEAGTR